MVKSFSPGWLFLLGLFAINANGSGQTSLAGQLAERDSIPLPQVVFQNEYAPRMNFDALLEPVTGIIHGAGQDPESYREYSALFFVNHRVPS